MKNLGFLVVNLILALNTFNDMEYCQKIICGGSGTSDRLCKVNQLKISGGSCSPMEWK